MTGIIAVETATDACSVAVRAGGEIRDRHEVVSRRHNQLVFQQLEELLPGGIERAHGIEAVAYGCGPGSFTGLRIAAGVAQGVAYARGLPAVAVSTLAVLAQTALADGEVAAHDVVLCVLDARIDEIYAAVYRFENGLAAEMYGPRVCAPGAIRLPGEGGLRAVGNGCREQAAWPAALRNRILSSHGDVLPRARDMIPLADALFASGMTQRPRDVQPLYVREEIRWKKLAEQGREA